VGPTFCLLTASLLAGQTEMPVYPSASAPGGDCNCQQGNQGSGNSGPFSRMRGWFHSSNDRCAERPGLVNRMKEWFGHGDANGNGYANNGYNGNGYYNGNAGPNGFQNSTGYVQNGSGNPNVIIQGNPGNNGYTIQQTPQGNGQTFVNRQVQSFSRPNVDSISETREPELARPPVRQTPVTTPAPTTSQVRPASTGRGGNSGPLVQAPAARAESKINPRFINSIGHAEDYTWITGQLDREGNRWVIRYATPDTVDRYHGQVVVAPGVDLSHLNAGELVSANGQITGQNGGAALFRATSVNKIKLIDEN